MNHLCRIASIFLLTISLCGISAWAQSVPFSIPGDDATKTAVDFSSHLHKPAGSKGFVEVRDGKFYVGQERIRFWGLNLCFGANFPTHEEADKVAPHLAKLGVNSMRFHHMDMQDAPGGIWKTNPDGSRTLDPNQLDRLDYFIAKLAENGIYSNINLHVSRTLTKGEGFPQMQGGPWWASSNKWTIYYDPDVQAELKKFCRELLTRPNRYRDGKTLANDPAIALVEMLNENFFSRQGTALLKDLPQRFRDSFQVAWNQWLIEKYETNEKLKKAWEVAKRESRSLFESAVWRNEIEDWAISQTNVTVKPNFVAGPKQYRAVRFEPEKVSEQRHFQQFSRRGLSLVKDQAYTLSFWVRADKKRDLSVEVSSTEGGTWRDLGVFEVFSADQEWKQITRTLFAKETTDQAYIALSFGNDDTPLEFANVELKTGVSSQGIPKSQSLTSQSISVPDGNFPIAAHQDMQQFMLDTEKSWILELKDFLRNECGVQVPITASQENYHGAGVLKDTVDYVDLHNYWHHPLFPADAQWSPERYTVGNVPIESYPLQQDWPARSLIIRTGWRYHDMPFTLSEWNHAEPSDVNTGIIMMAAVVGRLQDWDGIYFFDYESGHDEWFRKDFSGFFDFNGQPAKLAVLSAASNIFLRGDLQPLKKKLSGTNDDRLDGRLSFSYRLGVDFGLKESESVDIPTGVRLSTPDENVIWDAKVPEEGHLTLNTPNSIGVWGNVGGRTFNVGNATFDIEQVDRNYATLLATSLDNKPIESSKRILLLASSGAQNTDMKWNDERTSVGSDWGHAPTLINPVKGKVTLPIKAAKVFALDGTGKRIHTVETKSVQQGAATLIEIGPEHTTLWYEIEVQN